MKNQLILYKILPDLVSGLNLLGYKLHPSQYFYLYKIVEGLSVDFELSRLKHIVCPLLAKSPEDQFKLSTIVDNLVVQTMEEIRTEELLAETTIEDDSSLDVQPETENELAENQEEKEEEPEESRSPAAIRRSKEKNQKLQPKRVKGQNHTYVWNIVIEDKPKVNFAEQFNQTFGMLNYRQKIPGNQLNVNKTILQAVKEGAITDFYFKEKSKRASYLIMIQRDSFQNHESHFYDLLYQNLRENEISVERYFYFSDPRICWNEKHPSGINIYHLATRYGGANLIVIGSIESIINKKGRLRSWAQVFSTWEVKVLIPSNSYDSWAGTEALLSRFFSLIPPIESEIKYLASYIISGEFEKIDTKRKLSGTQYQAIQFKGNLYRTLEYYFSKPMVKWVAACAIYPLLYWDLTLFLGKVVADENENSFVTIENLLQLFRLPWFKSGVIPSKAREELIAYLDAAEFKKIVGKLIGQMTKNPPANHSESRDDYSFQLALLELIVNPDNKKALDVFRNLNGQDHVRKDQVLLQHLYQQNNRKRNFYLNNPIQGANEISEEGDIVVGQTVKGIINNILDYGAFVSLDGLYGLIHVSEIAGVMDHPAEIFRVGQVVEARIVNINKDDGKIALSTKRLEKEKDVEQVFASLSVGQTVSGVIENIVNYGVFLKVEDSISGLLHVSEFNDGFDFRNALKVGESLSVVIIEKNWEKKNISLSAKEYIKQEDIEEMFSNLSIGKEVKGVVHKIVDYGAFITIENAISGLLHKSEIDESFDLTSSLNVGDEVNVTVIDKNEEKKIFSLKLTDNKPLPWSFISELNESNQSLQVSFNTLVVGEELKGVVHSVLDDCAIVKVKGIYALMYKKSISEQGFIDVPSIFNAGDEVDVVVISIHDKRKVYLKWKEFKQKQDNFQIISNEESKWQEYVNKYNGSKLVNCEVVSIYNKTVYVRIEGGIIGYYKIPVRKIKKGNRYELEIKKYFSVGSNFLAFTQSLNSTARTVEVEIQLTKEMLQDVCGEINDQLKIKMPSIGSRLKGSVLVSSLFGCIVKLKMGYCGVLNLKDYLDNDLALNPKMHKQVTVEVIHLILDSNLVVLKIIDLSKKEAATYAPFKNLSEMVNSPSALINNPVFIIEPKYGKHLCVWQLLRGKVVSFEGNSFILLMQDGRQGAIAAGDVKESEHHDSIEIGQNYTSRVMSYDFKNDRFRLSLSKLFDNEWGFYSSHMKLGQIAQGVVTDLVDGGAYVILSSHVLGFVSISEFAWDFEIVEVENYLEVGTEYQFRIMRINPNIKMLSLSRKRVQNQ